MTRWAGWGAGPAGAGAAGGPSRWFLAVLGLACLGVAVALLRDRRFLEAAVGGGAAVYFALRTFGVLGGRR